MHVHTATVVANQWLRHERSSFAVGMGYILNHIFKVQDFVSFLDEGVKSYANLALTSSRNLVMVHFNSLTHFLESETHS